MKKRDIALALFEFVIAAVMSLSAISLDGLTASGALMFAAGVGFALGIAIIAGSRAAVRS